FLLHLMILRPPLSPLFPYTTLFRSARVAGKHLSAAACQQQNPLGTDRLLKQPAANRPRRALVGQRSWRSNAVGHSSGRRGNTGQDRKSTRLNSSHDQISYAVFCLKK